MQLLLRVKAAVGVAANPREFFRDATVAGLVRNLALAKGVVESPDAVRSDRASSGLGIRSNPRVPVVRRPKARSRK